MWYVWVWTTIYLFSSLNICCIDFVCMCLSVLCVLSCLSVCLCVFFVVYETGEEMTVVPKPLTLFYHHDPVVPVVLHE